MEQTGIGMTSKAKFKNVFKWLMSLFTFVIVWILFVIAFIVIYIAIRWTILGETNSNNDFELDDLFMVFFHVAAILSTILAQNIILKRRVNELPHLGISLKQLILGGAIGTTFMLSFVLFQFSFGYASYHFIGISSSIFTYLLIYSLVAINEELLFRGFLIPYLSKKLNVFFVVLISSLLFGFTHMGNNYITVIGFFNITLSGAFMALLYLKFKNLSAPIAFHFTWNFFQGPVFGYAVSGHSGWSLAEVNDSNTSEIWSGGLFGAEGSIVLIPMSLIAIVIFLVGSKRVKSIPSFR